MSRKEGEHMADYQGSTAQVGNSSKGGVKIRTIIMLLLFAFVGGIILAGWVLNHYSLFAFGKAVTAPAPAAAQSLPAPATAAPVIPTAATQRVDALEGRMSQINADALAASGSATRAEGMLVAFAARRAIDSGAPLGYVEDQLRMRFGGTQPQAVNTILVASAQPVTLGTLQSELKSLGSSLTMPQGGGVVARVEREFAELFVLRKEGTVSPAPTQKLKRAIAAADAGNIAGAVAEVQTMPGAGLAKDWLTKARNYIAAHKALDIIERSALMVPVAPQPATAAPAPLEPSANPAQ
jgi:hypothetical protein